MYEYVETTLSSNRQVQFEDYLLKNKTYNSLYKLTILQIVSELLTIMSFSMRILHYYAAGM